MAEIRYNEWLPPSEYRRREEEEARRKAQGVRRRQRLLVAAVLLLAGAGGGLLWWESSRRAETRPGVVASPVLPGPAAPIPSGLLPSSPGASLPASPVERGLELWYALTRSAELGETQVRATLQTPALVAVRATALEKGADWPARFDHDTYLYVEVRVGAARGALREAFLADPVGSLTLVDDTGVRVAGTLPEAFREEAVALTHGEGAKGVTGAAFLAAFPRAGLSRTTRFVRLEVANLAGSRRPGLTWEVTPGTGEVVLPESRP